MARCRPYSFLFSLNPPEQIDRGANSSWGVPDVLYDPQDLNNFLPRSRTVWEPAPSTDPAQPEGCPGPPGDLLQQCLRAAGITEQLLEAEARRDRGSSQPPVASPSAQPSVQHPGPLPSLPLAVGPAQLGGQPVTATALPVPQLLVLQQVPQRIILQVKQPGPTTLALLPSPAPCVLGSGQGPGPPAHKASGHPHPGSLSPRGQQRPAAAAPQHGGIPTGKAVGVELWHGESFWGLQPHWGKLDSFVSYF
ncbi:PREDICTED: classical arabinogalactan protein 9-like [Ficedula albicollis]|uniref:classical arabinogalactan protein 9-like n=1 Tax=Ficedula albicollis TaxID=59894 RepID=UPI0003595237|nr:PREDICTED: classical arabinogalactan protein 9-like [Ficedula albicollis]